MSDWYLGTVGFSYKDWDGVFYPAGTPGRLYLALYSRWLGRHGAFETKDQERIDTLPQLRWWREQIKPNLNCFKFIFGYFNNDYSGHSPKTCNRFKEMWGLPVIQPELPKQGRLF